MEINKLLQREWHQRWCFDIYSVKGSKKKQHVVPSCWLLKSKLRRRRKTSIETFSLCVNEPCQPFHNAGVYSECLDRRVNVREALHRSVVWPLMEWCHTARMRWWSGHQDKCSLWKQNPSIIHVNGLSQRITADKSQEGEKVIFRSMMVSVCQWKSRKKAKQNIIQRNLSLGNLHHVSIALHG